MTESNIELDVWKMNNPMFKEKISFDESSNIQFDNLTKDKELEYLKRILPELMTLIADPQITAHDLFPHMVSKLITKRIKELEK